MAKRTPRVATKVPPATPGFERPGYSDETKEHRFIKYAEDRIALLERSSRCKAEAASLRDELARVTEEASALKEHLDQAQAQLVKTGPGHGNVAMYR